MISLVLQQKNKGNNKLAACLGSISYWDNYVNNYIEQQKNDNKWTTQYIKSFYYQLVARALGRLNTNADLRILKVDLWNEGVETTRDVLGHFVNFDSVGFDLSKTICHLAKDRLYNSAIAQAACQNLPFVSGKFDLVLDLSTIDHMPFCKASEIIEEYYRVLRPNGLLAVAFWQSNTMTKYFLRIDNEQLYFDSKKVAKMLKRSGFKIVDSYNIGALLTVVDCNLWLGPFLFWRLQAALQDRLFTSAAKIEPYLLNLFGGLHVFHAQHP
jgi:SAM-dependent methyltransferase